MSRTVWARGCLAIAGAGLVGWIILRSGILPSVDSLRYRLPWGGGEILAGVLLVGTVALVWPRVLVGILSLAFPVACVVGAILNVQAFGDENARSSHALERRVESRLARIATECRWSGVRDYWGVYHGLRIHLEGRTLRAPPTCPLSRHRVLGVSRAREVVVDASASASALLDADASRGLRARPSTELRLRGHPPIVVIQRPEGGEVPEEVRAIPDGERWLLVPASLDPR